MICSNCGAVNADGSAFCGQCGAPLVQTQPVGGTLSHHPVVDAVKRIGASGLFLAAAVLLSVALLFSFIGTVSGENGGLAAIADFAEEIGVDEAFGALDAVENTGTAVAGILLKMLPNILLAVGVWMTFAAARNAATDGMSTAGLTMIKVIVIIELVLLCIGFVATEVMVIAFAAALQVAYSVYAGAVIVLVQLFLLPIFALIIVYISLLLSTLNAVKRTVMTGIAYYKASGFVAVMNFIAAAGAFVGAFFGNAVEALATLCGAAAAVLFGILIFRYRSALRPFAVAAMMPPTPTPAQYYTQM